MVQQLLQRLIVQTIFQTQIHIGNLSLLNTKQNYIKLAYILSRIREDGVTSKPSIGGSPYQVAIWSLLSQSPYPATSTKEVKKEAAEILACANAYYRYSQEKEFGTKPIISKASNFGKYEYGNYAYAGPFTVRYNSIKGVSASLYNDTISNSSGKYGELKGVYLNGSTTEATRYEKNTNGSFSVATTYTNFYVRVNPEIIENTIKVKQNNNKRTANFCIYHSTANINLYSYKFDEDSASKKVLINLIQKYYFCDYCMAECTKVTNQQTIDRLNNFDIQEEWYQCPHCSTIFSCPGSNTSEGPYAVVFKEGEVKEAIELQSGTTSKMQNLIYGSGTYSYNESDAFSFTLIPPLDLTISKTDTSGAGLKGAKFNVKATQTVSGTTTTIYGENEVDLTSVSNKTISITPRNKNKITVTITESKNPSNYMPISGTITVVYKYSGNQWVLDTSAGNHTINGDTYNLSGTTIKIENQKNPNIVLNLKKVNTANGDLAGAQFSVQAVQAGETIHNSTGVELPKTVTINARNRDDITVTIKETKVPASHIGLEHDIVIKYKYDESTETWKINTINGSSPVSGGQYTNGDDKFSIVIGDSTFPNCNFNITIQNRPKADFTFTKLDELTNLPIKDVKFKVNVAGCRNPINDVEMLTDANGKINLSDLEFLLNGTTYENIVITLEELEVPTQSGILPASDKTLPDGTSVDLPNYKMLDGNIVATIGYDNTTKRAKIISCTYNGEAASTDRGQVIYNSTEVSVTAKNTPVIHLGGLIWLDIQQGNKITGKPNGKIDGETNTTSKESGMGGRPVYLFKTTDGTTFERVLTDVYGNSLMLETALPNEEGLIQIDCPNKSGGTEFVNVAAGTYLFGNLPKLGENGYYIILYSYDGINYIATFDGNDQKADEEIPFGTSATGGRTTQIRSVFNSHYSRIIHDMMSMWCLTLNNDATISRTAKSVYTELDYDVYTNAQTGIYKSKLITTTDYNAENHLNGKDVKEEFNMYSKTKDGYNSTSLGIHFGLQTRMLDLSVQNDIYEAEVSVNGKTTIYSYNDIINAGGEITIDETVGEENSYTAGINESTKKYDLKLYSSDYRFQGYTSEEGSYEGQTRDNGKLKIYVTYAIALNNQGINNLYQLNEKAKIYSLDYYYDTNYKIDDIWYVSPSGELAEDLSYTSSSTNKTINGKTYKYATISGESGAVLAELEEGQRGIVYIRFEVNGAGQEIELGEYNNIAEINSYGTTSGLIDRDSEPGNITKRIDEENIIEDDTDQAMGLRITIPEERVRTIEGNVWEDIRTETGRDGLYKFGNGSLDSNENGVKEIIVKLYEVRPSGEVECQQTRTNKYGNYSFSGFIPGDYVVRFTYGDKTYNGVTYKSSIVSTNHYLKETNIQPWYYNSLYNIAGSNSDGNIVNKAMDSGLRRIKLISDYLEMDKEKHPLIEGAFDANAYMEAKTPTIFVAIDVNANEFSDTDGITSVKWSNTLDLVISGVSLGIEKRPETKITVEEHIKRITLKANDGKVLVNSEIDNVDRLFDNTIDITTHLTGIKDGLRAIKTIRDETNGTTMGFWEIQTDVSEVIQGAEIETEIVYQVKNESQVDYLSKNLVDSYNNYNIEDYKGMLNNLQRFSNRECLVFVGKTYYTGIIDSSVKQVSSKVGKFQDYVSDLDFKRGEGFEVEENKTYNKATGQTEINLADYSTILDLYEGNYLLKNNTTGDIITAIKDGTKYYKVNTEPDTIKTVLTSENAIGKLEIGDWQRFTATFGINGLTPNGKLDFNNYIAEIMSYSTANGRPDEKAIPGNLEDKYVYSQDSEVTLAANERDEFAGEKIVIIPPTGENMTEIVILVSAIAGGMAIIAVGVILIKKYVIK